MLKDRISAFDLAFFRSIAESGDGYIRLYSGEVLHGYSDWRETYYAPHFRDEVAAFRDLNVEQPAFAAAFDALISYHYENANTLTKSQYLKRGGVALDVGVRAGHWLVKASRTASEVIGVDATDFAEAMAKRHIAANDLPARFVRAAVGEHDGERRTFYAGSAGQSYSGFYPVTRDAAGREESRIDHHTAEHHLSVRSIDGIAGELDLTRLDLLVLEINGAELEALKGATETLNRFGPNIYVTSYHTVRGGNDFGRIHAHLEELNYRVAASDDTTMVFYR